MRFTPLCVLMVATNKQAASYASYKATVCIK